MLEYFKWFQSRLKLQAAAGVMPLGGNTVFFRREFLAALHARYGQYWDEHCLTEDCKIGIIASVLGYQVDVVYVDELVTREETPESLRGFLRQRVRWMQGFIQVFAEREWAQLPTLGKRVLALYVLGFQFLQALAGLLAPVGLALALVHKAPVAITLLATVPLGDQLPRHAARRAHAGPVRPDVRRPGAGAGLCRPRARRVPVPARCCPRPLSGPRSGSRSAATTG